MRSDIVDRRVNIRLKIGDNSLEVSGLYDDVVSIIDKLLPYLLSEKSSIKMSIGKDADEDEESKQPTPPVMTIKKGAPLTEILGRLFESDWGHVPHPLREVMDVLEMYGLYYPKSTVAVTLNRLVRRGVIRRIKTKEKYYLYVSTGPVGEYDG